MWHLDIFQDPNGDEISKQRNDLIAYLDKHWGMRVDGDVQNGGETNKEKYEKFSKAVNNLSAIFSYPQEYANFKNRLYEYVWGKFSELIYDKCDDGVVDTFEMKSLLQRAQTLHLWKTDDEKNEVLEKINAEVEKRNARVLTWQETFIEKYYNDEDTDDLDRIDTKSNITSWLKNYKKCLRAANDISEIKMQSNEELIEDMRDVISKSGKPLLDKIALFEKRYFNRRIKKENIDINQKINRRIYGEFLATAKNDYEFTDAEWTKFSKAKNFIEEKDIEVLLHQEQIKRKVRRTVFLISFVIIALAVSGALLYRKSINSKNYGNFIKAVTSGDAETVSSLIASGIDVNTTNAEGLTALMIAARFNHYQVAKLLIDAGANLYVVNESRTALDMARIASAHETEAVLVAGGADLNLKDDKGWTRIMYAVRDNDVTLAKTYIAAGADIDATEIVGEEEGRSVLMIAVSYKSLNAVRFLIDEGAKVNFAMPDGTTALILAAENNATEIASLLLENGANIYAKNNEGTAIDIARARNSFDVEKVLTGVNADVNAFDAEGRTPLMYAARDNNVDLIKEILHAGAKIDATDTKGQSALMLAITNGASDAVFALIDSGTNINVKDASGWTPLTYAVSYNMLDVMRYLVSNKADIDLAQSEGKTALMLATEKNDLETISYLIDAGAQIDIVDAKGCTAFLYAVLYDNNDIAKTLLNKSKDSVDKDSVDGFTPLMVAANNKNIEMVRMIVTAGANINKVDSYGRSAFTYAVAKNSMDVAEYLMENGADVTLVDVNDANAFMYASSNNNTDIMSYILKKDVDVNFTDARGWTALMYAAEHNAFEAAQLLIDSGANLYKIGNDGSALEIAGNNSSASVYNYLIYAGADPSSRNSEGQTPLMNAVKENDYETVALMIKGDARARISDTDARGYTALMLAAENNSVESAELLLKSGAVVNGVVSDKKQTPLMLAAQKNHSKIVQMLVDAGAKLNERDEDTHTALMLAAMDDCANSVAILVTAGADLDMKTGKFWLTRLLGDTALELAKGVSRNILFSPEKAFALLNNSVSVPSGSFEIFGKSFSVDAFIIYKHEITVAEYNEVMRTNPTRHAADSRFPVTNVSWLDAVAFCNALSAKDGLDKVYTISNEKVSANFSKNGWRLPTKAEWYWAAVGADSKNPHDYSGGNKIDDVAWYIKNSGETMHEVEQKQPNALGIYDMTGNVSEWCWDYYWDLKTSDSSYSGKNFKGKDNGSSHAIAGGFYGNSENLSRITEYQDQAIATVRQDFYGFRPVRK